MKNLFLIRHAKSCWDNPTLADFDRPLNKRGEINAPMMGQRLKKKKVVPDIVYSSTANRAKSTALLICKELKCIDKILFKDELYDTTAQNILQIIRQISHDISTIFIICHNPELNELAQILVGFDKNLPTTGILEINTTQSWDNISNQNCKFISFDYPKKKLTNLYFTTMI